MRNKENGTARLKRIARIGEWICVASFLLLAGYCVFLAIQPEEAVAVLQRGIPGTLTRPSNSAMMAAAGFAVLPVLVFLYGLSQVRNLFRLIGNGEFLTSTSQILFARLGRLAIILSIIGIVCHTIVVLLMTSANPPGQKMLQIEIDSGQIASLLVATLFFTFALLMKETAAIHEENQGII